MTEAVKVPPYSKESEMMVLGCMLTSIDSLNTSIDNLNDTDFYFTEHKLIYSVLKTLYKSDKPSDIHLVCEELKRRNQLQAVGGVPYVTSLAQYAGTAVHVEHYAEIVLHKAILRRMIEASHKVEKKAFEEPRDVLGSLDEAQQLFFQISQAARPNAGVHIRDILSGIKTESQLPYLKELQERQELYLKRPEGHLGITGISSGLIDLDRLINGLNPSNLMILAARPAMGKTFLALNIAEHVSIKENKAVGVFSLEMTADQLLHRVICSQSEVESDKIKTGSLNGQEYQRIVATVGRLQKQTIVIDDQPGLSISDLRARARRMKEAHGIEFLVVDYLQLISGSSNARNAENRQVEISEISRLLKNLARELNVPLLCIAQLSRKVEERVGHRPMLSDLRESGSIEQDADIILFLLRREYYDPMDKPGMAELILAKNRHGSVGTINLTFRKEFGQFGNYSSMEDPVLAI